MGVSEVIEEAKRVYAKAGLDCGDGLFPPTDEAALDSFSEKLGRPLPPELRQVYLLHGGQEYITPGVTGLFGEHRLHSLEEVVERYRMFAENCLLEPLPAFPPASDEWGYWVPQLIPFASWDANDLCIHDLTGEVWEFSPNCGLFRRRPSIAAVLQEVIEAVHKGQEPQLGEMRGPP